MFDPVFDAKYDSIYQFSHKQHMLSLFLSLCEGRSHDGAFKMYRLGQPASAALKQFVETGRSDGLEQRSGAESQPGASERTGSGSSSVLDEFQVPAIQSGAGRSEGRIFVDSNHTLVSLVTRIVPSPDWFVGVDSFEVSIEHMA